MVFQRDFINITELHPELLSSAIDTLIGIILLRGI